MFSTSSSVLGRGFPGVFEIATVSISGFFDGVGGDRSSSAAIDGVYDETT